MGLFILSSTSIQVNYISYVLVEYSADTCTVTQFSSSINVTQYVKADPLNYTCRLLDGVLLSVCLFNFTHIDLIWPEVISEDILLKTL